MSQWRCSVCGSSETRRRSKGMCHQCYHRAWLVARIARDPEYRSRESKREYRRNQERRRQRDQGYRRQRKVQVIMGLGGKCACCGEARMEFLTVDHINGDGAAHRKALTGLSRGSSVRIYQEIRRLGYPRDRFRVLCFNCNCALGSWGYCPHDQSRPSIFPLISSTASNP